MIDICRRLENKLDKVIGQLENLESRLATVEQLQLSQSTKIELNVTRIMQVEREQSTQADSLNFLHGMVDDMKQELGQLKSKTSDLENNGQDMALIRGAVDRMEQEKFYQNLLISGIPKTPNENLTAIITTLSSKMNIDVSATDVATAYRTKSDNIYIKFMSQLIRDKIYNNRKNLQRSSITSKSLVFQAENKFYINEVLDDKQKELFYQARCKRKSANYRFIWTFHGTVYMKKSKDSSLIKISQQSDLENL